MRILNFLAVGIVAIPSLLVLSGSFAGASESRPITARATSAGPTPLAGTEVLGSRVVQRQPGEQVDLANFLRWSGMQSHVPRPATYVMRNQEEWETIWRTAGERPPKSLPAGEMAVAVFVGPKPSEGYSAGIVSVRRDGENIYVTYVINKPRDPDKAGNVNTSPWLIQLMPSATGRVRFTAVSSSQ